MSATRRIAIIGAGLMGAGLARLFRAADWHVCVFDVDGAACTGLADAVAGAKIGQTLQDTAAGADFVIEAVSERAALKQTIFAELAAATTQHTILATNSSVIPVAVVTASLNDEDAGRAVGTHFWNPPDIIPLVEVIQGPRTSDLTIALTMQLLGDAGKEPAHVRRDVVPGNRLQHALWREAMALVDEGVCTPADIDHIVKRSFGLRLPVLGPLENADLVGLDLTSQIHEVVLPSLSNVTTPSRALTQRLGDGRAGVKSGAGFYEGWTPDRVAELRGRLNDHLRSMLSPRA